MLKLENLKTCHMRNAFGIDEHPYFSWMLESDETDVVQTMYQIKVFDETQNIIWDSGRVASCQDAFVLYGGPALKSRGVYRWKVWVWDNHGNEAISEQSFEMALLHTSDWKACWVKSPMRRRKSKQGLGKQDPPTMFRKCFQVKSKPVKARVYATCHGIYQLYLNGQRADDREFAPEHTVYGKYLCYQTYDITDMLQSGGNAVGMYVGDGWRYSCNSLPDMKVDYQHAVLFQIELTFADGSRETVVSDENVRAAYGSVHSSDIYAGEIYDATKEIAGWCEYGFDDSTWKNVKILDHCRLDNLHAQYGEPVRRIMEIPVKSVHTSPKGEQIIDFGQNICGRVRFTVKARSGQQIRFDHTEALDKQGNYINNILAGGGVGKGCDQSVLYIAKEGQQTYEPFFTFLGFRYVRVQGLDQLNPEDFTAVVLSSEKENLGSFSCSDDRLNRLYENTRWSQRANMLSIPTDCPQREKAGWTGDVQIYTRTGILNEDLTAFYTRWLENLAVDQDDTGVVPMVVPCNGSYIGMGKIFALMYGTKGKATSAGWGDAAVITPYRMYELTGNTVILEKQYDSMKKWCDYVITQANTRKNKKYKRDPEEEKWLWDTGFHYGEWLVPSQSRNGLDMKNMGPVLESSSVYTAPIFGYISVSYFAEIAAILGREQDALHYRDVSSKMKAAIENNLIDGEGNPVSDMMGAYVLFLYFDLVPKQYRQKFAARLVELITENGNRLDTGFLATPYLMETLCMTGHRDVAYRLLWQNKAPSWLYEVDHGATTIWESWFDCKEDGSSNQLSLNHYSFGCIDDWLFKYIGGVSEAKTGFKEIMIDPDYVCGLEWAKREYCCEHGKIVCEWHKNREGGVNLSVEIPCNTTAGIVLPDGEIKNVGSGKYEFKTA